jgi:hypothetical protein
MNSRFERIALAASELRGPFEDKVLRVKLSLIQERAAKKAPHTPTSNVIDAVMVEDADVNDHTQQSNQPGPP